MDLAGRHVTLRPPGPDDVERLAAILAEPSVAHWWPGYDLERVESDLIVKPVHERGWVVELDGRIVGYIQTYEEEEPDFRHATVDLFLASEAQGKGLGPDAIRAVAGYLIDERGHHRLTIDPAEANEAAVRAYTKVGFRPVGVMRQYQRMGDGTWADGLLMEMLAAELVR